MELEGRVALVTGGAIRLGRALTLGLARCGMRVAFSYNRSRGPAEETLALLRELGAEGYAVACDLTQPGAPQALLDQVVREFGRPDVLVNSAAIFEPGDWDTTTEEAWERHFALNLKAPFFLSQAFARLDPQREAAIINIADWRGVRPGTDHVAYTLTKAGLIAMTRSLAQALAPKIRVNAIAPGMILPPPGKDASYLLAKSTGIPLQRIGDAEDIVRAMRYLLEADFVTGELLFVTGGEEL